MLASRPMGSAVLLEGWEAVAATAATATGALASAEDAAAAAGAVPAAAAAASFLSFSASRWLAFLRWPALRATERSAMAEISAARGRTSIWPPSRGAPPRRRRARSAAAARGLVARTVSNQRRAAGVAAEAPPWVTTSVKMS